MKIHLSSKPAPGPTAVLVWRKKGEPVPIDAVPVADDGFWRDARQDGFSGQRGESFWMRRSTGTPWMLLGVGEAEEFDLQSLRLAAATAVRRLADARWPALSLWVPASVGPVHDSVRALAEGARLAAYRFDRHQSAPKPAGALRSLGLVLPAGASRAAAEIALQRAAIAVDAVDEARDLINEPAGVMTPTVFAARARALTGPSLRVRVYQGKALQRLGAGALMAVGRGSAEPPVLIHLHYRPARPRARWALVGKGVTFDSGGLSLKPADGMMTMKYDMAGAAVVLSVFHALRRLRPDVEVHGVTPVTENMPGPGAYKPGDVVRAMNGKTIEVLNTDAEGRVILADALSFAARLPVDRVVDIATLTGAAAVALGKAYAALMTDDAALERDLVSAAQSAGEKLWRLPLERSYRDHLKSSVADLKNIGNPGEAGTIIGGLFLKEFAGPRPWAHIDMAGVGWNGAGSPLSPPGATGAMVRTLLSLVLGGGKSRGH